MAPRHPAAVRDPWRACATFSALLWLGAGRGPAFGYLGARSPVIGDRRQGAPLARAGASFTPVTCNGVVRAGRGAALSAAAEDRADKPHVERSRLVLAWGCLGVVAYLSYGVKKVVPIVREGLQAITSPWQWIFLALTLFFFAYVEGYKGFQKGFSPRVVSRAWAVSQVFEGPTPTDLLKRYGGAYLMTSISLSLVSFSSLFFLVSQGFDVASMLAKFGIVVKGAAGKYVSSGAVAYALHKAASPIRFMPTVALTPVVAGWMGRSVDAEQGPPVAPQWHKVLAPAFCIGYFHGTNRRVIASWAVTTVIFLVVVGVKRLPNPYRGIIDAGVIVGLLWGSCSVLAIYIKSLIRGSPPTYNPSLPLTTPYSIVD